MWRGIKFYTDYIQQIPIESQYYDIPKEPKHLLGTLLSNLNIFVKTNSKYKEDDFSDSNALAFSQDACVHKIHSRHEVHTCNPRSFFPRLTPL